jgi:clan AA aspartic protease (TIGR02281 family)
MKKILLFILLINNFTSLGQSFNLQSGINYFKDDKYDEAFDFFTKEITQNPKESLSYFYNSLIYVEKEELAKALTQINLAIEFKQSNDTLLCNYWQTKGNIYIKLKDTAKFENAYEQAIKIAPSYVTVYIHRAKNYFDLEMYGKALSDLKKALEIDEVNSDALVLTGRVYEKQKKYAELLKQSEYLINLNLDLPSAYILKSYAHFYLNQYDEAITNAYNTLVLDPKNVAMQDNYVIYAKKNYTLALAKIDQLIKESPLNHILLEIRSEIFRAKKDYNKAIADYTKILELCTHNEMPRYYSQRGLVYEDLGKYPLAIQDYTKSISFDTAGSMYEFVYRGNAYRQSGNYAAALRDFNQAIELSPEESWPYYFRAWLKEQFLHDSVGGLADYNASIDLDKNYLFAYLRRGRLLSKKLGEPLQAQADFKKIIEIDTLFEESGNVRQLAYFELGQYEKAKESLQKIIQANPTEENYFDGACLYSLMKMKKEAIAYLDTAFQKGYRDFIRINKDHDLDYMRNMNDFNSLVTKWKSRFEREKSNLKIESSSNKANASRPRIYKIPYKPQFWGTFEVVSKVNGLPLKMMFDTGASDVFISQTEVDFMLKNGLLSEKDFTGERSYELANGDNETSKTLILRKVEFGGLVLKNVHAAVSKNKDAGMLFGQSAMSRYGKITIDNKKKEIIIQTK